VLIQINDGGWWLRITTTATLLPSDPEVRALFAALIKLDGLAALDLWTFNLKPSGFWRNEFNPTGGRIWKTDHDLSNPASTKIKVININGWFTIQEIDAYDVARHLASALAINGATVIELTRT